MLSTGDTNLRLMTLKAGEAQQLVIGFVDDRAAQITGLRWQDPAGSDPAARFSAVEVEVALESPLGPWQGLGTWRLDRAADGTVPPFDLADPTWARFVRLRAIGSMDVESRWELPGKVWVLERPTDDVYRSILGQWGQSSPRGIHESLVPAPLEAAAQDVDVGDTADAARPIASGEVANGRVARSADTDWYQLTIPPDQNTLTMTLSTERARDVRLRLYDAAGAEVPATITPAATGTTVTALVEPGGTYHVELEQPILSVVFAFDTSSSIKPWFPLVRTAIGSFAAAVRPGLEAIQVFPFEEPDLLESWSDQAYLIQSAIDAWTTVGGSSALEASIKRAAVTLAERDGARAILAVGDAVGGGFLGGLPVTDLRLVQPAIFPIHVGATDDPAVSTRIMQDLAIANGGFYQYATSLGGDGACLRPHGDLAASSGGIRAVLRDLVRRLSTGLDRGRRGRGCRGAHRWRRRGARAGHLRQHAARSCRARRAWRSPGRACVRLIEETLPAGPAGRAADLQGGQAVVRHGARGAAGPAGQGRHDAADQAAEAEQGHQDTAGRRHRRGA